MFTPNPNLFNQSFGGGLQNGSSLAKLLQDKRDRQEMGKLAELLKQGQLEEAGAGLVGMGQFGAGTQLIGYDQEQKVRQQQMAAAQQSTDRFNSFLNSMGGQSPSPMQSSGGLDRNSLHERQKMAESGGDPNAVSPAGAIGLMQIMPETAQNPGFGLQPLQNIRDPQANEQFGRQYMDKLLARYNGDQTRALVAYNWGAGNADKWNGDPNTLPAETRGYVAKILGGTPQRQALPSFNEAGAYQLMADPNLNDGQRAVLKSIIERRNEAQKPITPTDDIREYEFARGQGYQGSFTDFMTEMRKSGASSVNVTTGEGDKFYESLDKKNAEVFATLSENGMMARNKAAQVGVLEGLLENSGSGFSALMAQKAGEFGIDTGNLDDIQAAQALINKLVPEQRQAGSGPMSDADLALFKQSLPRIINTPEGNKKIIATLKGIAEYEIKMGEIADAVANREMSPADGRKAIRALENPLARGQNQTASGVKWSIK